MSYSTITQIITPTIAQQCAALDLYFTAAGGAAIVTLAALDDAGMPGKALREQRIERAQIKTDGTATRATWSALAQLQAGTSYALCVSAADTDTALAVAQVGEARQDGTGWVTAAPAEVGALLEINASGIVTRHANRMLRFDLYAAQYPATVKTVEVGTQDVENATLLLINAGAEQPDPTARITYTMELLGAGGVLLRAIDADAGQPVRMDAPHTGAVRVKATLRVGDTGMGAVLAPASVLAVGSLLQSGTYITPTIATAGGTELRVIFEGTIAAGAAVAVHAQLGASDQWTEVPYLSSSPQTAGTIELTHRLQGINAASLRLRLTLTGTPTARPLVDNLRAVVL